MSLSLVDFIFDSREPIMRIINNPYEFLFVSYELFELTSTAPRPFLLSGASSLRNTPRVTFAHCSLKGREIWHLTSSENRSGLFYEISSLLKSFTHLFSAKFSMINLHDSLFCSSYGSLDALSSLAARDNIWRTRIVSVSLVHRFDILCLCFVATN